MTHRVFVYGTLKSGFREPLLAQGLRVRRQRRDRADLQDD
jgi:gamma-glutamylcyclotransferase (GGCT)/AIG2-like uncharacterized protein YtfP